MMADVEAEDPEMSEEDKLQQEMKRRLAEARAKKVDEDKKKAVVEAERRRVREEKARVEAEEKAKLKAENKVRLDAKEAKRQKLKALNDAANDKYHAEQAAAAQNAKEKAEATQKAQQQARFKREQLLQFKRGNRKKSAMADYNWARDQGFITAEALLFKAKALEGSPSKIKEITEGGMQKAGAGKEDIAVMKDPSGKLIIRDDLLKQMESGKHKGSNSKGSHKLKGIQAMFRRGSSLLGVHVQKDEMDALSSQAKTEMQQKKLELKNKRKAKMTQFAGKLGKKGDTGLSGLMKAAQEQQKQQAAEEDSDEGEEKTEENVGDDGAGYDAEDEDGGEEDSDEELERAMMSDMSDAEEQDKPDGAEDGPDDGPEGAVPEGSEPFHFEGEEEDVSEEYSELGEEDAIGDWFNRDEEWIRSLSHEEAVDAMVQLERTHHSCRLQIQINRADGLPKTDLFGGKNDVYCIIYWMDKEIGRTAVIQDTLTPEWPFEVFEMLLPEDISLGRLRIEVYDDDFGKDDFLGMIQMDGEELLHIGMKRRASTFVQIDDGSDGQGKAGQQSFQLGILPDKAGSSAMKYVKEGATVTISQGRWRKLQLTVLRAYNLKSTEGGGNDVYVLVFVNGHQVHKTKRIDNVLDASWPDGTETIGVFLPDDPALLESMEVRAEVWDDDLGKDDFLGEVILTGAQMAAMLDGQMDDAVEKKKAKKAEKKARRGRGMWSALHAEEEEPQDDHDRDAHLEVVKPFVLQKKASVKAKKQKHVKGNLTLAWVDDTPTLGHDLQHRLHAVRHGAQVLRQAGVSRVGIQIHGASDLAITDMGSAFRSRADAYCLIYFDNHDGGKTSLQLVGRTATVHDSLNPTYDNEYFEIEVPVMIRKCKMVIEVWDHDVGRDDFLGMIELDGVELMDLPIEEAPQKNNSDSDDDDDDDDDGDDGGHVGQIALSLLKSKRQTPTTRKLKESDMKHVKGSLSISRIDLQRVQVQVCQAEDLPAADWGLKKDGAKKADGYVVAHFNGKKVHKTKVVKNDKNPVWTQEVLQMLMPHSFDWSYNAKLQCVLWDDDGLLGKDDYLGEVVLNHTDLMGMSDGGQKYKMIYDKKTAGSKKQRKPQGRLMLRRMYMRTVRLHILHASGLNRTDGHFGGLNDVYVVVKWNDHVLGRTAVIADTLNPVWESQTFEILIPAAEEKQEDGTVWEKSEHGGSLLLQVWDQDVDADDFLGEVIIGQEQLEGGRPHHKQDLEMTVNETMDRKTQKYVGGKLCITWDDPIHADRRDEKATEKALEKETKKAEIEAEAHAEEEEEAAGVTLSTHGAGAETIVLAEYPPLAARTGGDKVGSGKLKCEELGLGEWGGGMGMDAQVKYLSIDGTQMTVSLRAAILCFNGEFAINPFEVKLSSRIRPLKAGDMSAVIPWKDPSHPYPDGRIDWEYNHLYCKQMLPSRTVDGPAKETVMQAGPASGFQFKQGDYVVFHSKLLTPALKPRVEDYIDKNDGGGTDDPGLAQLPEPMPQEVEQEYCGSIVNTPMHRQGVGFVSDYRVRWFRGVRLCPGTGLFKAVMDWEGGGGKQIGLFKKELLAAEAFSIAFDQWWIDSEAAAKMTAERRLPPKERRRKARRRIRDARMNAVAIPGIDKKTSCVEWVQEFEGADAIRGKRYFQPQPLSPRTMHKKYSAMEEQMTGQLPDIEETKEDLQAKAMEELGIGNPTDRMIEVEKERVEFHINDGDGNGWRSFSTKVTNMKILLLREDEVQTIPEAKKAKLRRLICEWEEAFIRPAFLQWMEYTQWRNDQLEHDKMDWAARKLQGVARGRKQRIMFQLTKDRMRKRAQRALAHREHAKKRAAKQLEKEKRRNEKAKDDLGLTLDGTIYFSTKTEMHTYYAKRKAAGKMAYYRMVNRWHDLLFQGFSFWTQRIQELRDFAASTSHHPVPRERLEAIEGKKHRAIVRKYRAGEVIKVRLIRYDKLEYELPEGHPEGNDQCTFDVRYEDGVIEQGLRRHILRAWQHGLVAGIDAEKHAEMAASAANAVAAAVAQAADKAADAGSFAAVACMFRGAGIAEGALKAVQLANASQEIFMVTQNRHTGTLATGVAGDPHRRVKLSVGTLVEVDMKGGVGKGVKEGRGIWHPVLDIAVPRLSLVGAHGTPDGGVAITSFGVYSAFKDKMAGPTDNSNWLVHGRILCGAYPEGQARVKTKRVTARSASVMQILLSGVGVFVGLMEKHELIQHRPGYRPDVIRKYNMLKAEYRNAFDATTLSLRMAEKSMKQAEKYGKQERERVSARMRKACVNWQESYNRLNAIPRAVDFIDYPMATEGAIDEEETMKFVQALESRLRPPPEPVELASLELYMLFKGKVEDVEERVVALRPKRYAWVLEWCKQHKDEFEGPILKQNDYTGEDQYTSKAKIRNDFLEEDAVGRRIYDVLDQVKMLRTTRDVNALKANDQDNLYLFSEEGHGRAGVIGGLLLGRIYGLTPAMVVERMQRLHDIRPSMDRLPAHERVSHPRTQEQRSQLVALLEHSRPMLSDVERRDDLDFSEMRSAARGMGIPKLLPSDYASSSVRVQAAMDGTPLELVKAHRGVGVPRTHYVDYETRAHSLMATRNRLSKEEAQGRPQPEIPQYAEDKDFRKKRPKRVREWGEEHSDGDDPEDAFASESDYEKSGHESSDSSDYEPMKLA
jgi:hypothetical protein